MRSGEGCTLQRHFRTEISTFKSKMYIQCKRHRMPEEYELYVFPDDDKRYAIETCRSSESVLKK
jgi:hypothetical protein